MRILLFEEFVNMKEITYDYPNFEYEWEEAKRYPEFVEMGKEGWLKKAKEGFDVDYTDIKDVLGNVDLDFDSLEEPKKERFSKAFSSGKIEMPIAVKFADEDYDLVAGNTRLSGLVRAGIDPKIWVVDISKEQFIDEKNSHLEEVRMLQYPGFDGVKISGYVEGEKAKLNHIEVKAAQRGSGIGTQAVQDFEKWAKENGAKYVEIDAYKKSIEFWEKMGYELEAEFPVMYGHKQDYKTGIKKLK